MTALFTLLVVIAPLPFGAVHPRAVTALAVSCFLLALVALSKLGTRAIAERLGPLLLPLGCLACFLCLQILPLPHAALAALAPWTADLYARTLGDTGRWLTTSLDPYASSLTLVRVAAYTAVFAVAACLPTASVCRAVVASGALAAAVSWLHVAMGWQTKLFGIFAPNFRGNQEAMSWPFVNATHLAILLGISTPLALAAAFSRRSSSGARIAAGTAAALMLCTLAGTHSRTGILSLAAGLTVLVVAWPARWKLVRRPGLALAAACLIAGILVVARGPWHPAKSRDFPPSSGSDQSISGRLEISRQSLTLVSASPLVGVGLGGWRDAFARAQSYPLPADDPVHAHNDYVEWLCEVGLAGLALSGFLVLRYARGVALAIPGSDPERRAALLGALACAAVSACFQFAARMPAIAVLLAAVLGALWCETRHGGEAVKPNEGSPHTVAWVVACLVLALLSTREWRDQRLSEDLDAGRAVAWNATGDWRLLDRAAWSGGRSTPDSRLAWVAAHRAPLAARPHRTLAYSRASVRLAEMDLSHAAGASGMWLAPKIELARLLVTHGRRDEAVAVVEEAYRRNPLARPEPGLVVAGSREDSLFLIEAAARGVESRAEGWPKLRGARERFVRKLQPR